MIKRRLVEGREDKVFQALTIELTVRSDTPRMKGRHSSFLKGFLVVIDPLVDPDEGTDRISVPTAERGQHGQASVSLAEAAAVKYVQQ
jgi:hypothetical protein